MNIGNINNPAGPDKAASKIQDTFVQKKTSADPPANAVSQKTVNTAATENKVKDVFVVSKGSNSVQELNKTVENMVETPREDLIAQAQERVRNGFYNTADFTLNVATKMVSEIP